MNRPRKPGHFPKLGTKHAPEKSLPDCALHVAYYGATIELPKEHITDVETFVNRATDCGHKVTMQATTIIIDGVRPVVFPDILDEDGDYEDELPPLPDPPIIKTPKSRKPKTPKPKSDENAPKVRKTRSDKKYASKEEQMTAWYEANREQRLKRMRERHAANRDEYNRRQRERYLNKKQQKEGTETARNE